MSIQFNPFGPGPQRPGDPNPTGFGPPPPRPGDPSIFGPPPRPERVLTEREQKAVALIENGTVKKTGDKDADLATALAVLAKNEESSKSTSSANSTASTSSASNTSSAATSASSAATTSTAASTETAKADTTEEAKTATTETKTAETKTTSSTKTVAQQLSEIENWQKATGFGSNKTGNENIDANQNGLIEPEEHLAFRLAADHDGDGTPTEFDMNQFRTSLNAKDPNAFNLFWTKLNYVNTNKSSSDSSTATATTSAEEAKATTAETKVVNQNLSNLAKTFGVSLSGDDAADKAKVKERANSMLNAIREINPANYNVTMPNVAATLGVAYTGNIGADLAQMQTKAASIKSVLDQL